MNLQQILKDKRINSYSVDTFNDEEDVYFFYIKDEYISTWENGSTITDEKPFKYISDMLKAKNGIIKK